MRWARHVACRNTYRGLARNLKERDQLIDLGVDGTILTWTLKNMIGGVDWINLARNGNK
jgi:hypothetical protein